jgi:2-C-methyl-D-erythritol 4-phosphate cytidylyltransferase
VSAAAILTAAGSGSRFGGDVPKALVRLAGDPLVVHAARRLRSAGVHDVVVTAPPAHRRLLEDVLRLDPALAGAHVTVVDGGPSRQASVAAGMAALDPAVDVVLVHDAARALTPPRLIAAVAAAVRAGRGAVVPGLPVTDTIKEVGPADDDGAAPVRATPDRSRLRAVQTPQGFERALLEAAHAAGEGRAGDEAIAATDDAALVEALGAPVWVIPGHRLALKITTAGDLALAERLLAEEGEAG